MKKIVIWIQWDIWSTNEKACKYFAKKNGWNAVDIKYLISTENVLIALQNKEIDYWTFAWESSKAWLVKETQEVIKKYKFQKVDEEKFFPDHVLFSRNNIDINKKIKIYSHKQALLEHKPFLDTKFSNIDYIEEVDTWIAAKKLSDWEYENNSIVIAPIWCSDIFDLNVYLSDLPTNKGYFTTLYLVQS